MPDQIPDEKPRVQIDWVKIFAGALAAVSSAVVLSTLGAAGTIVGAALGSVVVSVSSSLYSTGLARSRERVARAQGLALQRVGVAQAEVRRANRRRASDTAVEGHLGHADEQLAQAQAELDELTSEGAATRSWGERLAALPWKRIALLTVGLFVVAMVAITVFELIAGQPVSNLTGGSHQRHGTTFSDIGGGGKKQPATPAPPDLPTSKGTPTVVPTAGTTATQAPTPSPTASGPPTPSPSEIPTTEAPTPSLSPSASPTAGAS